ncbi:MAG: exodeoxyribonuclease VII small subunit [Phycisphaerales bacterium]
MKKPTRKPAGDAAPTEIDPQVAARGFEVSGEQLEALNERKERGEIALEDSLREYARGDSLVRRCRQILDQAEQRIEAISGQALDAGARPDAAEPPF